MALWRITTAVNQPEFSGTAQQERYNIVENIAESIVESTQKSVQKSSQKSVQKTQQKSVQKTQQKSVEKTQQESRFSTERKTKVGNIKSKTKCRTHREVNPQLSLPSSRDALANMFYRFVALQEIKVKIV